MINKNISFITINELESLLKELGIVDSSKMLIQLFCANTDKEFIKQIQLLMGSFFPKATLIGSTTDGIIENQIVHDDTKYLASFTSFESTDIKSSIMVHSNTSFDTGVAMAESLVDKDTKVIISFADGINSNGEEYVNGINSVSNSIILSGGLAADNGNMQITYVFDKTKIISIGAVGISLK